MSTRHDSIQAQLAPPALGGVGASPRCLQSCTTQAYGTQSCSPDPGHHLALRRASSKRWRCKAIAQQRTLCKPIRPCNASTSEKPCKRTNELHAERCLARSSWATLSQNADSTHTCTHTRLHRVTQAARAIDELAARRRRLQRRRAAARPPRRCAGPRARPPLAAPTPKASAHRLQRTQGTHGGQGTTTLWDNAAPSSIGLQEVLRWALSPDRQREGKESSPMPMKPSASTPASIETCTPHRNACGANRDRRTMGSACAERRPACPMHGIESPTLQPADCCNPHGCQRAAGASVPTNRLWHTRGAKAPSMRPPALATLLRSRSKPLPCDLSCMTCWRTLQGNPGTREGVSDTDCEHS